MYTFMIAGDLPYRKVIACSSAQEAATGRTVPQSFTTMTFVDAQHRVQRSGAVHCVPR